MPDAETLGARTDRARAAHVPVRQVTAPFADRRVLPLQALPAPQRRRCGRSTRRWRRRRFEIVSGADARAHAGGRAARVPEGRSATHCGGHLVERRRHAPTRWSAIRSARSTATRDPAAVAPVARVGARLGADPGRRPPALQRRRARLTRRRRWRADQQAGRRAADLGARQLAGSSSAERERGALGGRLDASGSAIATAGSNVRSSTTRAGVSPVIDQRVEVHDLDLEASCGRCGGSRSMLVYVLRRRGSPAAVGRGAARARGRAVFGSGSSRRACDARRRARPPRRASPAAANGDDAVAGDRARRTVARRRCALTRSRCRAARRRGECGGRRASLREARR